MTGFSHCNERLILFLSPAVPGSDDRILILPRPIPGDPKHVSSIALGNYDASIYVLIITKVLAFFSLDEQSNSIIRRLSYKYLRRSIYYYSALHADSKYPDHDHLPYLHPYRSLQY